IAVIIMANSVAMGLSFTSFKNSLVSIQEYLTGIIIFSDIIIFVLFITSKMLDGLSLLQSSSTNSMPLSYCVGYYF
ncbi:hypothetical protein, partial [Yersinia pestis]